LVVPFTLIVIFPTNKQLSDSGLDVGSTRAGVLLGKWNRLHAIRSAAGLVAFVVLLLLLGVRLLSQRGRRLTSACSWPAVIALMEAECCALTGTDSRPTPLRRRGSRPQLKRDPL